MLTYRSAIAGAVLCAGLACGSLARAQCVTCGTDWPASVLSATTGQAADFAPRRAGAEVGADIRFGISSAALYRVTQPQLVAAGLTNPVGSALRLFCRDQEVAIQVSTAGALAGGDYLEFHGTGHRGYYSATNVYWLAQSGTGLRMATQDGATNAGGALVSTYDEVVEFGPDLLYRDFYRPLEDGFDHWFAALLTNQGPTLISMNTAGRVNGSNATVVLRLFGLSTYTNAVDHRTDARINGTQIASFLYDGESDQVMTGFVATALLTDGNTSVSLQPTQAGVPFDYSYLDWIQIGYPRALSVRNNSLTFCGRAGTNVYVVGGLTTNAGVAVLDITAHAAPVAITNFAYLGNPPNVSLAFRAVTTNAHRYFVAAPSAVRTASAPQRVYFRNLANTNRQADYLMVTPYAFREPAYRLLKHRASNGLAVAVAPLEDVYNEFGYGLEDAAPIQQFIGYAFHHWGKPVPRYALLMGEGTYDPRNYLGQKPAVHLPVKLGPTPFSWSPRDNWYGAVNGTDTLVDVSIGRIPAVTTQEVARVVGKTVDFERRSRIRTALLVADNIDVTNGLNFATASQNNVYNHLFFSSYSILSAYLDGNSVSALRTSIQNAFVSGRHVVNFFGHGQTHLWCGEDIWNTNDVAGLTNARFPVVTIFSCQNGSFEDPARECLAEAFLEGTTNGASAVMAPAAESVQPYAERVAYGFYLEFTNETTRLGDSLNLGLLNLWNFNKNASELWSYGILGDPALRK